MKIRKNRKIERAAVNSAHAFFEANGCIFQEIDLGNDYGKDAYVDFAEGENVTGICFALQIKGGSSYHHGSEYRIPLDAEHAEIWSRSTVPIIGIVYDPVDIQLRWCNISNFLDELVGDVPSYIPIRANANLTPTSLHFELITSLERSNKWHIEHPILNLISKSEDIKLSALYDCFALGRSDARVLIVLRYLLKTFDQKVLFTALRVLSHVTSHPDIFWGPNNWIISEVKDKVRSHLIWDIQEIIRLLSRVTWEQWDRGSTGEDLYMILLEDPDIQRKMKEAALAAIDQGEEEAAFTALYLSVFWAGGDGLEQYREMITARPNLRALPLSNEVEHILQEFGYLTMF